MYSITFKFEQKGLEPITLDNVEADQSLLEIALNNNIELHHKTWWKNCLIKKRILLIVP
jgi:hypothetical protein